MAGKINIATSNAQDAFRRLMKLQQTPDLLRQYASFLMEVVSDDIQGQHLLKRAAELEELRTHQNTSMTFVEFISSLTRHHIMMHL